MELVTIEQQNKIDKIKNEIEEGFKSLQMFRSEFLMRNSVLAMPATIDGQYWQAILERNVHFWELTRLKYDFDEKLADIEFKEALYNSEINKSLDKDKFIANIAKAKAKKIKIQIDRNNTFLIHMKKEAEQRIREVLTWTKIIEELKPQLKYSLTNPEEHQTEEWARQYAKRIDLLTKMGSKDIDATMNIVTVADKIFKNEKVQKLMEEDAKLLQK